METFFAWFGPIIAICMGVMMLALFFKVLHSISSRLSPTSISIKGFLKPTDAVTVHLNRGETLERVRFVGFTDPSSLKGMPYQLANLVILESQKGERILLRADSIRRISQVQAAPDSLPDDNAAASSPDSRSSGGNGLR